MAIRSLPERIARAVLQGFFMTDGNGFDDMSNGSRAVAIKRVEPLLAQLANNSSSDKVAFATVHTVGKDIWHVVIKTSLYPMEVQRGTKEHCNKMALWINEKVNQ